jgi:hypothetical protein
VAEGGLSEVDAGLVGLDARHDAFSEDG